MTARRRSEYKSLHRSKGRRELGQFLVEGVRAVESALEGSADLVDLVVARSIASDPRVAAILDRAPCPVFNGADRDVQAMTDAQTGQGVLATVRIPDVQAPAEGPWLVLDGIQDPGNVGTLIRTAAWYGVSTVVWGPGTADPYQPKAVRSTQGGLWDLTVVRAPDLRDFYGNHSAARPIYVADLGGGSVENWRPPPDAVLVLGSEAHGPSDASRGAATAAVSLPRKKAGATESLNASVAGAILLDRWLGAPAHSPR